MGLDWRQQRARNGELVEGSRNGRCLSLLALCTPTIGAATSRCPLVGTAGPRLGMAERYPLSLEHRPDGDALYARVNKSGVDRDEVE